MSSSQTVAKIAASTVAMRDVSQAMAFEMLTCQSNVVDKMTS